MKKFVESFCLLPKFLAFYQKLLDQELKKNLFVQTNKQKVEIFQGNF